MPNKPEYDELDNVIISAPILLPMTGYIIDRKWQEEKQAWIYKVSVTEPEATSETFDNWVPAHWLKLK
ncbi:MAG TPA: hypothetical protein VNQ90_15095 [Chthoniobacteraceae bacterium]|nr:hypothetical protein [Chthoniobacteraceae bacterium]